MKNPSDNLSSRQSAQPTIQKSAAMAAQDKCQIYKIGDVIGNEYEVLLILGKGGLGIVYLVCNRLDKDLVIALKTITDELLGDSSVRESFKKEANLWVNMDKHPNILPARYVEELHGRLFIAMQPILPDDKGRKSLADHLNYSGKPLDANLASKWAIQFCLGMEHANAQGIRSHRDIKPANILIDSDGTLKITDFGLAVAAGEIRSGSRSLASHAGGNGFNFSFTQIDDRKVCGTPGYIPPEIFHGEGADVRSDIYSFGLVLWQISTGSKDPPFIVSWPGTMDSFLRGIYEQQMACRLLPPGGLLEAITMRCLRPKPCERYKNFQELRADLELVSKNRVGIGFANPQILEISADDLITKGQSLTALGRCDEALGWFDKVLVSNPKNAFALYTKGIALDNLCRYQDAMDCYDRALAVEPLNATIWINKAYPLLKLGRNEEALICYEKALAIDPQKENAWSGKGICLKLLGRNEEALDCCEKALLIDPRHTRAWNTKGNIFKELGRHNEAISCYNKALVINPRYTDAWYNKALTWIDLKNSREAVKSFQMFLECAPPQDTQRIAYARQQIQELEPKIGFIKVNRFIFYDNYFDETNVGVSLCKNEWAHRGISLDFIKSISSFAAEDWQVKYEVQTKLSIQDGMKRFSHTDPQKRIINLNCEHLNTMTVQSVIMPFVLIHLRDIIKGKPTAREGYFRVLKMVGWNGENNLLNESYLNAELHLSYLVTDNLLLRMFDPPKGFMAWCGDLKANRRGDKEGGTLEEWVASCAFELKNCRRSS